MHSMNDGKAPSRCHKKTEYKKHIEDHIKLYYRKRTDLPGAKSELVQQNVKNL